MAEYIEFIECASLSIGYAATGKATVSLSVIRDDGNELVNNYNKRSWGSVNFDTVVMSATQNAIIGSRGWAQWALQMEGVGK